MVPAVSLGDSELPTHNKCLKYRRRQDKNDFGNNEAAGSPHIAESRSSGAGLRLAATADHANSVLFLRFGNRQQSKINNLNQTAVPRVELPGRSAMKRSLLISTAN